MRKNGYHKTIEKLNNKTCQIASMVPPWINPDRMGGVVHGISKPIVYGMIPTSIARYVRNPVIIGTEMNGNNKIGFNTIGIPNSTVSLMKKIPRGSEIRPKLFKVSLFENNTIKITKPNVDPAPPNVNT